MENHRKVLFGLHFERYVKWNRWCSSQVKSIENWVLTYERTYFRGKRLENRHSVKLQQSRHPSRCADEINPRHFRVTHRHISYKYGTTFHIWPKYSLRIGRKILVIVLGPTSSLTLSASSRLYEAQESFNK